MASEAVAAKAAEERGKQADAKVVDFESIAPKNAAARNTVRSGAACDLDAQERRREGVERAGRLREELGEGPVTGIEGRLAYRFAKRAFDVAFSAAVLVAFCWLFAIIAALIKADDPKAPVLFKQRRVGKGGQTFQMYKFRSMCVDAEERLAELRELNEKTGPVFKMAEDPRVTRVGRWLRKLSLDELPQFINVLAGDIPLRILKCARSSLRKAWVRSRFPPNLARTKRRRFRRSRAVLRTACGCTASLSSIVTASAAWKPSFLQNPFSVYLLCIRELCFRSQIAGWLKQHGNWWR